MPLPPEVVAERLAGQGPEEEIAAAARLAGGDVDRAEFLLSDGGRALRREAERMARAMVDSEAGERPWQSLLEAAEAAGAEAEREARARMDQDAGRKRSQREIGEEARRVGRRRRTEVLDLGLELCAAWLRDLGAVAAGADEVVLGSDRISELRKDAAGLDSLAARRCVELVQDTRRRLDLNVSEELALEALFFRAQRQLAAAI